MPQSEGKMIFWAGLIAGSQILLINRMHTEESIKLPSILLTLKRYFSHTEKVSAMFE